MKKSLLKKFLKSLFTAVVNILVASTITFLIFEHLVCNSFNLFQFIGIFACIEMVVNFISVNLKT